MFNTHSNTRFRLINEIVKKFIIKFFVDNNIKNRYLIKIYEIIFIKRIHVFKISFNFEITIEKNFHEFNEFKLSIR